MYKKKANPHTLQGTYHKLFGTAAGVHGHQLGTFEQTMMHGVASSEPGVVLRQTSIFQHHLSKLLLDLTGASTAAVLP